MPDFERPEPPSAADVLCVGEAMVLLTPADARRLDRTERLAISIGGAESNVALYLSDLGVRAAWLSHVGDDPFGRRVVAALRSTGVDVSHVEVRPEAPTAVYFKDPDGDDTAVHYYRRGSAASRMGPESLGDEVLSAARVVHMSGITPALSDSCAAMVDRAAARCRALGTAFSFDVNHRPGLWPAAEAAPVLRDLARRSDIVFVGRDEGERLWGTPTAEAIAEHLGLDGTLVVKDGAVGATEFREGRRAFLPAPEVEVVEPVGAGDAFAAGYLAAWLRPGGTAEARLGQGHALARRALTSIHDFAPSSPMEGSIR